jgi:hypothetical protein
MSFNSKNIICIHLTRFYDLEDFRKMLRDNGLSAFIEAKVLFNLKQDGYLKLWLDNQTFRTIAWTTSPDKKRIHFSDDYAQFLKDLNSLTFIEKSESTNLNLDQILDKIAKSGIESLTTHEKQFLDQCSKS